MKPNLISEPPPSGWSLTSQRAVDAPDLRGASEVPISYYWSLLRRHRWKLATFVLVTTAGVTLYALTAPKLYDATITLQVDPLSAPLVGENQQSGQVDAGMIVSTEAAGLIMPAVVSKVIDQEKLANDPEFGAASDSISLPQSNILQKVTNRISIETPVNTLLIKETFRSRDPQLSARVANALAADFLEHENGTRATALADSSRSMSTELDAMRAQMERDQTALVEYEARNDVIDADDRSNIYQASLSQINDELGKAQADRLQLEAEYRVVLHGGLDALLASAVGQQLVPLRDRLRDDERRLAQDASIYGPKHPVYQQQLDLINHDQQTLNAAAQNLDQQITEQYRTALTREQLIQSALDSEKQSFDDFNLRAIRYRALKAAADGSSRLYYELQQRIQDATVAGGLHSEQVRIVDPALPPHRPASPRPLLDALITLLGSTLIGAGVCIAAGLMDRTVASPEQAELRFGLHVIGSLPEIPSRQSVSTLALSAYKPGTGPPAVLNAAPAAAHSPYHEAVYSVFSAIQFSLPDRLRSVAISSSLPGEGKSTLTCHLAMISASLGIRTVLVDADMRKPRVHRITMLPNRSGLYGVLRGSSSISDALQTGPNDLQVLCAGANAMDSTELLHLGFAGVLDELQGRFENVFIDCPPLLGLGDSLCVARLAGGIVMVVHAGVTKQDNVAAALRQLKSVRANIIGFVLNRVRPDLGGQYEYYAHYGRYYQTEDSDAED